MVKHHIKNLILYKLVVVEGRLLRDSARAENPFFSHPREKEGKRRTSHRVTTFS